MPEREQIERAPRVLVAVASCVRIKDQEGVERFGVGAVEYNQYQGARNTPAGPARWHRLALAHSICWDEKSYRREVTRAVFDVLVQFERYELAVCETPDGPRVREWTSAGSGSEQSRAGRRYVSVQDCIVASTGGSTTTMEGLAGACDLPEPPTIVGPPYCIWSMIERAEWQNTVLGNVVHQGLLTGDLAVDVLKGEPGRVRTYKSVPGSVCRYRVPLKGWPGNFGLGG